MMVWRKPAQSCSGTPTKGVTHSHRFRTPRQNQRSPRCATWWLPAPPDPRAARPEFKQRLRCVDLHGMSQDPYFFAPAQPVAPPTQDPVPPSRFGYAPQAPVLPASEPVPAGKSVGWLVAVGVVAAGMI